MRIAGQTPWERIEFTLSEYLETLRHTRMPTRENWVGKNEAEPEKKQKPQKPVWKEDAPQWFDPEVGVDVRAWQLGAYLDGIDMEHLEERRQFALEIAPKLERLVAAREATPEFISLWGDFCGVGEIFELLLISDNSDPHAIRQSETKMGKAAERRSWLGHYLVQALKAGHKRQKADQLVEQLVLRLLYEDNERLTKEERDALKTHTKKWFMPFVKEEKGGKDIWHLRDAYRMGKFHEAEVRKAAANASKKLPSLKIKLRDL